MRAGPGQGDIARSPPEHAPGAIVGADIPARGMCQRAGKTDDDPMASPLFTAAAANDTLAAMGLL